MTWTLAILYKVFGPSEFWLRSFNATLGLLTVIIVYKLSAYITKSSASAYFGVIILLSDIEFLFRSRQINVEIPLTFFLLLTLYAVIKEPVIARPPLRGGRGNLLMAILAGASLGLAFLTKRASPILILPALLPVLTLNKLLRTPPKRGAAISFLISFLIVATPWYIFSYLRWGNQFINEFFLGYTLGKIRSVNPGTGSDIFFYINALRHAFKFFSPLVPLAIIWATVKSFRDRKIAVLVVYILTFLIFLTLAPIKSSWFLLPIHPAIAIITGLFIWRFAKLHNRVRSFANFSTVSIIMVMIIAVWQIWHYHRDFIVPDTAGHQAALAKLAGQLTEPQNSIYLDDDYLPVAVFYSRRRVIPLRFGRLQPITPLPIPPGSYILTSSETLPTLQNTYPSIKLVKESADLILAQSRKP